MTNSTHAEQLTKKRNYIENINKLTEYFDPSNKIFKKVVTSSVNSNDDILEKPILKELLKYLNKRDGGLTNGRTYIETGTRLNDKICKILDKYIKSSKEQGGNIIKSKPAWLDSVYEDGYYNIGDDIMGVLAANIIDNIATHTKNTDGEYLKQVEEVRDILKQIDSKEFAKNLSINIKEQRNVNKDISAENLTKAMSKTMKTALDKVLFKSTGIAKF